MYGASLGDMIGSPYEFKEKVESKDFDMFNRKIRYTDDSMMTIAIADALLKSGKDASEEELKDNFVSSMQIWGRKYPKAGYGGRFRKWLKLDNPQPYGSYGNGSAMRVSPVGWFFDSLDKTIEAAGWSAEVTHNHPEGIKGAKATAAAIYMARQGFLQRTENKAYGSYNRREKSRRNLKWECGI